MEPIKVACPAKIGIANAQAFRTQLLEVAAEGPVAVDASGVSHIDAAGIQLLLAFTRGLEAQGRSWSWDGLAPAVQRAAENLGLTQTLKTAPSASEEEDR